jgi:UDP-N-acetylglucosamine/UDP-N-acetylgalactosamine diphosphorylase
MSDYKNSKWDDLLEFLQKNDQMHLARFFEKLPAEKQATILENLAGKDIASLRKAMMRMRRSRIDGARLKPAKCIALPNRQDEDSKWQQANERGIDVLKRGEIAVVTAAGGNGTRLGFNHSKGLFQITPVKQKTLFQLFAEKIRAGESRYGCTIPWLIMTAVNHKDEVQEYFEKNDKFGLSKVYIFPQGQLPSMGFDGKLLLSTPDSISANPDGHGGLLMAIGRCGMIEKLQELGIRHLSYCQIDNPLAMPLDPVFVGFHVQENAQMSSRCVNKAFAGEKIGVFAMVEGKLSVIEHQDLPHECAAITDAANCLHFRLANVAIHIFDIEFIKPFCQAESHDQMPLHAVQKKIPYINSVGHLVNPIEPNGVKFEYFIFDLLRYAQRTLLLEGQREKTFSPIKNPIGIDSPETSQRDQMRLWADWLVKARVDLIRDSSGVPPFQIEIAPSFAVCCEEFLEKWNNVTEKPVIGPNFYLS